MKYLFIFSLFMFILVGNLLGMFPYSFTWTSHIIVTFSIVFLAVTVIVCNMGGKILKIFC